MSYPRGEINKQPDRYGNTRVMASSTMTDVFLSFIKKTHQVRKTL